MTVAIKKKGESNDKLFRKFSKLASEDNVAFDVRRKVEFKRPLELQKDKIRERHRLRKKNRGRY